MKVNRKYLVSIYETIVWNYTEKWKFKNISVAEHVVSIREDGRKFSLNVWKSSYRVQQEKITVWSNFHRANVSPSHGNWPDVVEYELLHRLSTVFVICSRKSSSLCYFKIVESGLTTMADFPVTPLFLGGHGRKWIRG